MRRVVIGVFFLLGGCGEEMSFRVDHYVATCEGEGAQTCLRVAREGEERYRLFFDDIADFDRRWGHRYELRVTRHEVDDPPEDGSSARYELDEVISDEVVPLETRFTVQIYPSHAYFISVSGSMGMYAGADFVCEPTVCEAVAARIDASEGMIVDFGYDRIDPTPLLRAFAVR